MTWAMSFPLWTCRADGCGMRVEWCDAECELDSSGRLVAVRHRSCAEVS